MKLAKSLTTVTPFSKFLAMLIFIIFPFIGFYLGISYQKSLSTVLNNTPLPNPSATTSAAGLYNVSIFIKERTSDVTLNKFTEDIKSLKGVKSVNVITKEKALLLYKERNKDNPGLIENVTSDFFPTSLEVNADTSAQADVVKFAKSQAIVSSVLSN